jgi:glucosyl-3-phosphoglycerate synthase
MGRAMRNGFKPVGESTRLWHHSEWPAERVAAERSRTVSVCLPARNEVGTIGPILEALVPLIDAGAIDQVAVVDDSDDGTGELAEELGAEVYCQSKLHAELGPVDGKGDAMWRALQVLHGEVVCYLDADSEQFGPHYACGLVGPAACIDEVKFVKGFYRRPFRANGIQLPHGGGRVTELTARPLLNVLYPELAIIRQPLAGEIAADAHLLRSLPFATGYAVDVALLIDAWRKVGLGAIGQVDLDVRQNQHQPLHDLSPMAAAVARAILIRVRREGRLSGELGKTFYAPVAGGLDALSADISERPPAAALEEIPEELMRAEGLEPPRAEAHQDLNLARMPIPPRPRERA